MRSDPKLAAAKSVQALTGLLMLSVSLAAFDWRAGLGVAGAILFAETYLGRRGS